MRSRPTPPGRDRQAASVSVSAADSTTMSPGDWSRSMAVSSASIPPTSPTRRCIGLPRQPGGARRFDRGRWRPITTSAVPCRRRRRNTSRPGCPPPAPRPAPSCRRSAAWPLIREHAGNLERRPHTLAADRRAVGADRHHDEAVEIVVVVLLALQLVMALTALEVRLGGGREAEQDRRSAGRARELRSEARPARVSRATIASTSASVSGETRSALLTTTRSAQRSWSSNSSSTGSSCMRSPRSAPASPPRARNVPPPPPRASTTVTTPSTVTAVLHRRPVEGAGPAAAAGARPDVSMTMWSGAGSRAEERLHGRQELVRHRAADAAVGQLDDLVRPAIARRRNRRAARRRSPCRRTR